MEEAETVAMAMISGSVLTLSVCRETKGAGCVFPLRLQKVTFADITWNRGISAEEKTIKKWCPVKRCFT